MTRATYSHGVKVWSESQPETKASEPDCTGPCTLSRAAKDLSVVGPELDPTWANLV